MSDHVKSKEIDVHCAGIKARIIAPSEMVATARRDFRDFVASEGSDIGEPAFTLEFVTGSPDMSGFREGAEGAFVRGNDVLISHAARFRSYWLHWMDGLRAEKIKVYVEPRIALGKARMSRWISGDFMTPQEQVFHDVFYHVYLPRLLIELLERNFAMIHAAGLVNRHGAFLIAGDAEVGKTRTLLDLASNKGLLGDDLLVIGNGKVHALPKKVGVFGYHTNHGYAYRGFQDRLHWILHSVIARGYSLGLRHVRRTMPLSDIGTVIRDSKLARIVYLGRSDSGTTVTSWSIENFVDEMVRIMFLEVLNLMNAGKLLATIPSGLDWISNFVDQNREIMSRELEDIPIVRVLLSEQDIPSVVLCELFPELTDPLAAEEPRLYDAARGRHA